MSLWNFGHWIDLTFPLAMLGSGGMVNVQIPEGAIGFGEVPRNEDNLFNPLSYHPSFSGFSSSFGREATDPVQLFPLRNEKTDPRTLPKSRSGKV